MLHSTSLSKGFDEGSESSSSLSFVARRISSPRTAYWARTTDGLMLSKASGLFARRRRDVRSPRGGGFVFGGVRRVQREGGREGGL